MCRGFGHPQARPRPGRQSHLAAPARRAGLAWSGTQNRSGSGSGSGSGVSAKPGGRGMERVAAALIKTQRQIQACAGVGFDQPGPSGREPEGRSFCEPARQRLLYRQGGTSSASHWVITAFRGAGSWGVAVVRADRSRSLAGGNGDTPSRCGGRPGLVVGPVNASITHTCRIDDDADSGA